MKTMTLAALALTLMGGAAIAQPHDDHHGGPGAAHGAAPSHGPAPSHAAPAARDHGPAMAAHDRAPAMAPRAAVTHPMENHAGNARHDAGRSAPSRAPAMHAVAPRSGFNGARTGFNGARPGAHHLPPGISAPHSHDRAPNWRGRSWAVGDLFAFAGFRGPSISAFDDYGLPSPRPGTHWIYVDGWFLMVGNRTGRIFDEIPADY